MKRNHDRILTMSNAICHWELMVNDMVKAKSFYS